MQRQRSIYFIRPELFLTYLFPPILIIGNYFTFHFLTDVYGNKTGYLFAMFMYWLLWCLLPVYVLIKKTNLKLLLKIKRLSGWQIGLLIIPVAGAFIFGPLKNSIGTATPMIIFLSLVFAFVNAFSEEFLWRGLYFDHHQANFFYAIIVPSIWFGIWHYAPLTVQSSSIGNFYFILISVGLGLCWAIVTYFTRSVFWGIMAHTLVDFSGWGTIWFYN
jgi:membrane protease YdiL (CAAX protease family)